MTNRAYGLLALAGALTACTAQTPAPGTTQQKLNQKEAECSKLGDEKSCLADGCDWIAIGLGRPCLVLPDGGADCGSSTGSCQAPPQVDPCARILDEKTCAADGADKCTWIGFGRACPLGQACQTGVCEGPVAGSGGGTIGGGTGCACPDGKVCVEQVGGPAVQQGTPPNIVCEAVPQGCNAKDVCQCFAAQNLDGCHPSVDVAGLCLCDNGIR